MKNKNYLNAQSAKLYLEKSNLLSHTKTVHEKQKTFECQICKKSFGQKNSLLAHKKETGGMFYSTYFDNSNQRTFV